MSALDKPNRNAPTENNDASAALYDDACKPSLGYKIGTYIHSIGVEGIGGAALGAFAGPYASALVGGIGVVDGILDARDILKGKELDCLRERQLEKK